MKVKIGVRNTIVNMETLFYVTMGFVVQLEAKNKLYEIVWLPQFEEGDNYLITKENYKFNLIWKLPQKID